MSLSTFVPIFGYIIVFHVEEVNGCVDGSLAVLFVCLFVDTLLPYLFIFPLRFGDLNCAGPWLLPVVERRAGGN